MIEEFGKDMKIVYTPLHGTGEEMLTRVLLAQAGFDSVQKLLKHKQLLDPRLLLTVKSPNPESQAAFALLKNLVIKVGERSCGNDLTLTVLVLKFFKRYGNYLNLSGAQIELYHG